MSRNKPEIIVCAEYFTSDSVHYDSIHTIQHAAKLVQKDIFDKFKGNPQPTATELQSDKFIPPSSLILFMKALLTLTKTSIDITKGITGQTFSTGVGSSQRIWLTQIDRFG